MKLGNVEKFDDLTGGQWKALGTKLGGIKTVKALLQGTATFEIKQAEPKDFPIWRTITIGTDDKKSLRKKLKDGGFYVFDWASDILGKRDCTISKEETELDLVVVSVAELGYKNGATTQQIYDRAEELGLELCPAEVGPQLRVAYTDQPKGEWIHVAMKSIKDSDGDLLTFYVGRGGDGVRYLDAYYVAPDHRWGFDDHFVFVRRKN